MRYETGDDSAAAADVDEIGRRRSWVCVCVFNSKTAAHHALSIFVYVFDVVVVVVVAASGAWVLSCTDVYRRRRVYHDIRVFAVMVFFMMGGAFLCVWCNEWHSFKRSVEDVNFLNLLF